MKIYDTPTQVKFIEMEEYSSKLELCGIAYNDFVICGECGEVIPLEMVKIVKEYPYWITLSDYILYEQNL